MGVRYAVGINSIQMRAIRYCLMQPGLSIPKISILCGGPDWPTSVLCGILGVPLKEAMIGTSPVLVLYLAYTVMAGAFTLKLGSDLRVVCSGSRRPRTAVAAAAAVAAAGHGLREPRRDQLLGDGQRGDPRRRDDLHVLHLLRGGVLHGGHRRE